MSDASTHEEGEEVVSEAEPPEVVEAEEADPLEGHGRVYWAFYHLKEGLKEFFWRHKFLFTVLTVIIFATLFMLRGTVHPYVIMVRTRIFLVVLGLPTLWVIYKMLVGGTWLRRIVTAVIVALLAPVIWHWGDDTHHYMALYRRYQNLPKVKLDKMPLTGHERIQPLNSIHSLAHEAMGETDSPQVPDLVRIGDDYKWVIGIEPAYDFPRMMENVEGVLAVSATAPSPNFKEEPTVEVNFATGENMLFGRNSFIATIKTFSPWRYLNYEPADVTYLTDDDGEWVQVVELIRWRGILFPWPEFGGVQVIRQEELTPDLGEGFKSYLERVFLGMGRWIPPEDIKHYAYLRGQNICPYEVTRYIAASFKFQEGFWGPLPGIHRGDVRIPDLESDVNPQPFTVFFDLPKAPMLYQYFALEPVDVDKQGLNTSVLAPADGSMPVYYRPHFKEGEVLLGVSAVSPKVMESKKNYDWTRHRPVEHRPVIRDIGGERPFMWLTTVVTLKDQTEGDRRFIAGAVPEIALTNGEQNVVAWVSPARQHEWVPAMQEAMAEAQSP